MKCDVLIIGAGLVGASLAAALRGCGLKTVLLDAEAPPVLSQAGWDNRIYALSPGSRDFLHACGVWQRLPAERIARVEAMQVFGDEAGAEIFFSAYECNVPELCFIVESREIQRALYESYQLPALNAEPGAVHALAGETPSALAFDEHGVIVDLAGGEVIAARLVVGADGPSSWVREIAGFGQSARCYGQHGVVANFATEVGHESIARQWFLADGILALLPLPGNRVSLVWSTSDAQAARLLSYDSTEFEHEIATACHFALGEMRLITAPASFPLRLLRVAAPVRPRLALIGDAAHIVHPLAGQGLNLGLQDARELARVLRERGPQDDCGDYRLLRRYARARSEAVTSMQLTTDGLQRLFGHRAQGIKWLRNRGLRFTNGILPLKNALIEHALV